MLVLPVLIAIAVRVLLVLLFLPFSALDKVLNFSGAVAQAEQAVARPALARLLVFIGLAIEVIMSAAILSGVADKAAALILAGYCMVTAMLWKQFWQPGDFRVASGKSRALFWDFLKNFALAGGFLLITFGTTARSVDRFWQAPLSSSHPYQLDRPARQP